MGERGLDGGHVPEVFARQGLLHADPDAVGRRAHDDVLQVLQGRVRTQMEGLSGIGDKAKEEGEEVRTSARQKSKLTNSTFDGRGCSPESNTIKTMQ